MLLLTEYQGETDHVTMNTTDCSALLTITLTMTQKMILIFNSWPAMVMTHTQTIKVKGQMAQKRSSENRWMDGHDH